MNNRLTVLQHHPAEGVGELGVWAAQRGIALEILHADLGELPGAVHGPCVLLGGPYGVKHRLAWLQRERAWLREHLANAAPTLGICLGAQLVADALGGQIRKLEQAETGWTRIEFVDGNQADGSDIDALQWHDDAFTPPPDARALASSAACEHQMFAVGTRIIGMQFHPEWNAALVDALNAHFGDASPLPRQADTAKHERVRNWFHHQLDAWWTE